jgi:hypothetical protein
VCATAFATFVVVPMVVAMMVLLSGISDGGQAGGCQQSHKKAPMAWLHCH